MVEIEFAGWTRCANADDVAQPLPKKKKVHILEAVVFGYVSEFTLRWVSCSPESKQNLIIFKNG